MDKRIFTDDVNIYILFKIYKLLNKFIGTSSDIRGRFNK
jgi:hypothetical protein